MKKSYLLALLPIAAISFSALPARADKINTQIINQTTNIDGDGNTVIQDASQINIQRNQPNSNSRKDDKHDKYDKKGGGGNMDNYQEINQDASIRGRDNYVEQNANQTNVQNSRGRKHPGRGHAYGHDKKK